MKISNASLIERIKLALLEPKARIEIVSEKDLQASRKLKKFVFYVASELSRQHPDLKVIDVFRTEDPFNFQHPIIGGMFKGYAIAIPRSYNLFDLKKSCMKLEFNSEGERICDIDVYENKNKKISRTDLGYKK